MEPRFYNIRTSSGDVTLRVARGHFATKNSHINYFLDVTATRCSLKQADAVATQLKSQLQLTMIDTIICMDNTRVIGTCLAQQLTKGGFRSMNSGEDIYLLRDNVYINGKLIFRDNTHYMLKDKNVLILLASITTGGTVEQAMRTVRYYGGNVVGIASIYSYKDEIDGVPIVSLFHTTDLPGYESHSPETCPMCAKGIEVDAVVDRYGYSAL